MTRFKFGRKYHIITNYDEAYYLCNNGFISHDDYYDYCRDNIHNYGTHSPVGTHGTSGTSGTFWNPQNNLKFNKKYYFKGKFPKPR
jgi:hypothetical protein